MPPLCATMPIRFVVATSGTTSGLTSTAGLNVAATRCTWLKNPSAFGPEIRMPVRLASAALLGKTRGDDDGVLDARGGALLERGQHGAGGNDDDGEIDRRADPG